MKLSDKLGHLHIRCWRDPSHNSDLDFRNPDKSPRPLTCDGCRVGVVSGPYTAKRLPDNLSYQIRVTG